MEKSLPSIEAAEKKGGKRFRRRQQLTTLSLGLDLLKRSAVEVEGVDTKRERIEQTVHTVLKVLPVFVTSVRVGDEIVTREGNAIEKIPQERQRQWTPVDIDQYTAVRARSAGIRWERRFPSSPGS